MKYFFKLFYCSGGTSVLVSTIEAYFDESERRESGVFCVAGYAFLPRQARRFIKEWTDLFKPYGGFHMKELAHSCGRFVGISRSEHDRLIREAVRIVNQRKSFGVAVSCALDEVIVYSQNIKA